MRTIELNPKYEYLQSFITRIPDNMDSEGTYIYGGRRNLIKLFVAPDGTQLNVKRYKKPAFPSNIIYSTGIRKPKGRRAFIYPAILLENGINTPEAVAYIEDRHMGLLQHSWFISIQCPYSHRMYELGNATEETYAPIAKALAEFTAHMHDCEVLHLDYSPGNILWEKVDLGSTKCGTQSGYRFSIVDINRMHFGPVSMKDGCRNFMRLWGPKHFIELLVEEYALLRGFSPKTAVDIIMAARKEFWAHYQKKREMEFKLEL